MRLTIFPTIQRLAIVFVCLSLLMAFSQKPPSARAAGSFVVNTSNDIFSTNGLLSLREALAVANGTFTGPFDTGEQAQLGGCTFNGSGFVTGGCGAGIFDTITFDSSVTEITPGGGYATLIDNGTWIAGAAGVPRINAINLTDDVFKIAANDVTISNLSIVNGALGYADIRVQSGKDARLAYNYLGTIPAATNCSPTGITHNATAGVIIEPNTSGATGANNGVAYIYGNVIGCHWLYGIVVSGADYVYIGVQPDSTTIDGNYIGVNSSQANLGHNASGIFLDADITDGVRYAQIYGNTISHNGGHGVLSEGTGSNVNTSNFQNVVRGNIISDNGMDGIHLEAGTNESFIGGLIIPHVNTITLNNQNGIKLISSNSNLIQGNLIGASTAGNALSGIYLETSDSNILTVNNIQSNGDSGVWLYNSDGNTLTFNSIGTDFTIASAAPNSLDGVTISNGSASNTVGGIFPAERNFISGNTLCGVRLRNNADNNTVTGNLIGLNYTGDAAIPNGNGGVCLQNGSDNNHIGVSTGEKQYISGNAGPGVFIENSDLNDVRGNNRIGLAVDDTSPMGNAGEGILVNGSSSNMIFPGFVAFNQKAGIAFVGTGYADIRPTFVGYNGGLPIDLGNDGFTPNDPGDVDTGPNDLINYPLITSYSGSPLNLQGTTCASCVVYIYETGGNPAIPGGSANFLAQTTADAFGNWSLTLPAGYSRHQVTAMTYKFAITSEFSPTPVLYLPLISKP